MRQQHVFEAFAERPRRRRHVRGAAAEDLVAHVSQQEREDISRVLHDLDSLFGKQDTAVRSFREFHCQTSQFLDWRKGVVS